jgi:tripartite-type tricarboxylate transporter receptor subunit TctC
LPSLAVLPDADRLFDRKVGYEVGDLMPIARILADPSLLVVRADAPWKTAQDYIAALKAAPRDSIPYGSSGAYGTLHIAMEMFAVESGLRPLHVPFTGAGPALNALLAGDVKAIPATPGVIKGQLEAKAVRVLASWGAERVPAFKDVPTFKELGFPGIEYYNWAGLFGPKTLPAPIVDRLRAEMKAVMADPSVIKVFEAADSPPAWLDKPDFEKFVAADTVRLVAATKKVGRVE